MSTEYKNWLATKKEKATEGDVAEYVAWYVEHPSPLGGLFGRELTRPEIIRQAVSSVASSFKGAKVEIHYSGTPEAASKIVSMVTGTIVGPGVIAGYGSTRDAIIIQADHTIVAVPTSEVVELENA